MLGGAIGLEREIAGKPAGLRTNILICMGATLLTDVSIGLVSGPDGTRLGDPSRLAAQIVTGIGFLGAGHYLEAAGAGVLVTLVLAGLGNIEHRLRRARRVLSATVRAKPGFAFEELDALLSASGIKIIGSRTFDHAEDRVFELKLSGPARQYDVVTEKLLVREDILSVNIG